MHIMEELYITYSWKINVSHLIDPVWCMFMSLFIERLSRNGLKYADSTVIIVTSPVQYRVIFCIFMKFLVLILVSVVIMVRYFVNMPCLAICKYLKNLEGGEGVN